MQNLSVKKVTQFISGRGETRTLFLGVKAMASHLVMQYETHTIPM